MNRILGILVLTVWLSCQVSSGFAENQTWVDKKFDFSAVKSVYLYDLEYVPDMTEEIVQLQMRDIYYERADKLKKVQILTRDEMEKKLLRYSLIDYAALEVRDEKAAAEVWQTQLPKFAELTIQPVIQQYEVKQIWQEPYTYTTTRYEDITIDKDGKKTTISVPRTEEKYVPGRYIYNKYIKVKFNVYSTKSNKLVFSYMDYREAQKERIDMYRRIVDSFYSKLNKSLR